MTLHDTEELDNDLGRRTNKNLTLSTALGIDDIVQAVVLTSSVMLIYQGITQTTHQDGDTDHFYERGRERGLYQGKLDMREQSKQLIYADPSLSVVLQKARVKQGKRNISMIHPLLGQPLQTVWEEYLPCSWLGRTNDQIVYNDVWLSCTI